MAVAWTPVGLSPTATGRGHKSNRAQSGENQHAGLGNLSDVHFGDADKAAETGVAASIAKQANSLNPLRLCIQRERAQQ